MEKCEPVVNTWEPITLEELKSFGTRIDSEFVCADSMEGLCLELSTNYPHEEWVCIRGPAWCGDKLVILVVKPRVE